MKARLIVCLEGLFSFTKNFGLFQLCTVFVTIIMELIYKAWLAGVAFSLIGWYLALDKDMSSMGF